MKKSFLLNMVLSIVLLALAIFGLSSCDDSEKAASSGHEHAYTENVVAPTCTEQGYTQHTCACGESYKDTYVAASGHTEVTLEAVSATCTEDGLTEGKKCSVCQTVTVAQQVVGAAGHAYGTWIEEVATSCGAVGTLAHYHCSACNKDFDASKTELTDIVIPTTSHTYGTWINEVAAGCETSGTLGHYHCSGCNNDFDADYVQITDLTIAPQHDFGDAVWHWASDGSGATVTITCARDNTHTLSTSAAEVTSELTSPATCKAMGITTYTGLAILNGTQYTNNHNIANIPMLEHNFVGGVCTGCGDKETSEGLAYELNADGKSYSVAGKGTCTDSHIKIPATYNGLPVTAIGKRAFKNTYISGITLPTSVTSIGYEAFYNCESLATVTLHEGLTSIDTRAFSGCTSLSYTENGGLTYLGTATNPYMYLIGVSSTTLTTAVLHENCKLIASAAFGGCSNLATVTLNNGLTWINRYAFSGCTGLQAIEIPTSVKSLGEYTFEGCTNLTTVTFSNNSELTAIGTSAFQWCNKLAAINLSTCSSLTEIGNLAFTGCTSLSSILLPNSLALVGSSAFQNCNNLSYTTYNGAKYLGNSTNPYIYLAKVTSNSIYSATIHSNCKIIGDSAFMNCTDLQEITIPNGVRSISYNAFYHCAKLPSITIPASVLSIGYQAFAKCYRLVTVNLNTGLLSIEGYAFTESYRIESIVIPDSVLTIGASAFYQCSGLSSVTIGTGVETIGGYAFYKCTSLTKIVIPSNVTSIGEYAFAGCTSLSDVTLGSGLKTIGNNIFGGCYALTDITIPASVVSIGKQVFYNCSNLTSVTFENTNGWHISTSETSNGSPVDVTNTQTNAGYFLNAYNYYWKRIA